MDLIKGITSDHELIELANLLDIELDGIFTLDEIKKPLPKNRNYIILLENGDGIGHWVCTFHDQYFDSAGEPPPLILGIKKYNHKQYQSAYREYCGIWCLLFLYAKQNHRPDLLDGYYDLNDKTFE